MTLLRTEGPMPGLDDATTTAAKRIARWNARVDWAAIARRKPGEKRPDQVIPGVDTAALSSKYGMERAVAPQVIEGTFRVPLGTTKTNYLRLRARYLKRMIEGLDRQGYEFCPNLGITVKKGMYPAVDLLSRKVQWDQREMRILAYFRFAKPEPVRIELPSHMLTNRVVTS